MRRMNVVSRKRALKVVKELDAFPKIPESYQESTPSGGGGKPHSCIPRASSEFLE